MARRKAGVPESARGEIVERAASGSGHDPQAATEVAPGVTVPACEAVTRGAPSPQMLRTAYQVCEWLKTEGASHVDCVPDSRPEKRPGALVVRWVGDPKPRAVAERFATGRREDGLPMLPSWLALRADSDFDLRWQPPL